MDLKFGWMWKDGEERDLYFESDHDCLVRRSVYEFKRFLDYNEG